MKLPLRRLYFCCLGLLAFVPVAFAQQPDLPASDAIWLDGRITEEAWAEAARHDLAGGGEVRFKWNDSDLYLAVGGEAFGWSHVYLQRGDTLLVFHASAALGTAVYARSASDRWDRLEAFEWAVRDTSFSPEAEAGRTAFFEEHGWIANTNMMGTRRVIEFRIAKPWIEGARLAVVYASDPEIPLYWPDTLNDATLDAGLIAGTAPERLDFDLDAWAELPLR